MENGGVAKTWLGYPFEAWTAGGTVVLGVATLVLVIVGIVQLISIRDENARTRTLAKCDQYDLDPVLDQALRRIASAKAGKGLDFDERVEVATVLNYLDSLAIGIAQGLYIKDLARDHMRAIVASHVDSILQRPNVVTALKINPANYHRLTSLNAEWMAVPTAYNGSSWFRRIKKEM